MKAFTLALMLTATLASYPAAAASPSGTQLETKVGGRTIVSTTGEGRQWTYQWPGVYFEARFKGPVVSLKLTDPNSHYRVLIDGVPVQTVALPAGNGIDIAGLAPGAHVIRLEKLSETQGATGRFDGFFVPAKTDALPPPAPLPRRIEFIGDSLSVGYGDASASISCTGPEAVAATDTQRAFGPLTAKRLEAEYQVNAYSGIGLVRNYAGGQWSVGHLPDLWQRVLYADPTPAPAWSPQVIVVAIGTNDFSPFGAKEAWPSQPAMTAQFEAAYATFVHQLRSRNPKALIVLAWAEGYPPGFAQAAARIYDGLRKTQGASVDRLVFPPLAHTGCDQHPDLADNAKIADALEALVRAHPQVWAAKP